MRSATISLRWNSRYSVGLIRLRLRICFSAYFASNFFVFGLLTGTRRTGPILGSSRRL